MRFWTRTCEEIERKCPGLNGIGGGELDSEEQDELLLADKKGAVSFFSRLGRRDELEDGMERIYGAFSSGEQLKERRDSDEGIQSVSLAMAIRQSSQWCCDSLSPVAK